MWLVFVGLATAGLLSAKAKANTGTKTFTTLRVEEDAYAGWLTEDGQTDSYAALASLSSGSKAVLASTWQQSVAGRDIALAGLVTLSHDPNSALRAQAVTTQRHLTTYNRFNQEVHTAVLRNDPHLALEITSFTNAASSNEVQADFDAMSKSLAGSANDVKSQVASDVSRYLLLLVILAVMAVAGAATILLKVKRSITRPVADLEATLQAVATGNLAVRSRVTSTDELGRVGSWLNEAIGAQQLSVAALADSAQTLGTAAEELSSTSTQLSANAEHTSGQANSVSDASATMSDSVQSVAAAAEELTASIAEITNNVTEAARVGASAVALADVANLTISQLGDSSKEIGKVIKLIGNVAERTNLLALNATIEAVRAGEAGKGFGVVAGEVKELAKQTAEATEDIAAMVDAIQTDTHNATDAVSGINSIISQINELQTAIAAAVEEQTATTTDIARNVSQAAVNSGQITRTVTEVAETASTTSIGALDTQRAAGELARMAVDLQHHVDRFRY
jgi:methyl-accepting chemotaxis protein